MDDDRDGVIANIRACIISSKGAVPVSDLIRDYSTLVGSSIPYRKFSYSSLDSFLQSIESLRVYGSGRDATVQAATHTSSSHISSLIAKQKSTKKKDFPPPRRSYPVRSYGNGRGGGRGYLPRSFPSRREQSYRRDVPSSVVEPESLVIRVGGNDKRQVTVGELMKPSREKYEVPPRLQKLHNSEVSQVSSLPLQSPPAINDMPKVKKENFPSSQAILSPIGPSQLIAAGRAKQQADIEEQESFYINNDLLAGSQVQADIVELEHYYLNDDLAAESQVQAALGAELPHTFNLNELQEALFEQNTSVPDLSLNLPELPTPPAVPLPDETCVENNISLLLQYTMAMNWCPPDYQINNMKRQGGPTSYLATVKISEGQTIRTFKSFPFESPNIYTVKGYAAKLALKELLKEEEVKHAKKVISSNKKIICARVSDIVAGVFNGIFSKKVEEMYVTKYCEHLPDDWIQIVSGCPTVSVESSLNNVIIIPRDHNTAQELCFKRRSPAPPIVPEAIDLRRLNSKQLDVFVTHATSVSNVWFRLIGDNYSEKYEDLLTNMTDYYNTFGNKEIPLNIERGQYYAAQSGDDWFRVCISEVDQVEKKVIAWLIDHGDNDEFLFNNLCRLPTEFCELPRQAIHCSLEGLESFNDDSFANQALLTSDHLIGKSLIAQINLDEQSGGFVKATLYDTSGSDDVNVNEKIQDSILYIKADPRLPQVGCAMEVYISHISKRGEIYIQLSGSMYNHIYSILESLEDQEISKHKLKSYRQVATNKMYIAKYNKDGCWYRAVVTSTPSMQQNLIAVCFIDFGNCETVSITDIADVQNLPPIINKLPPQAVKVALHNLPVESLSSAEILKLNKMLLDEKKVILIKTINLNEDPPVVEIFGKNENSGLESVIATIEMDRLQENLSLPSFSDLNTSANGHDSPALCLRRPELEKSYTKISVILAANPGNFYFQPKQDIDELKTVMVELQEHYETTVSTVPTDDIIIGRVFAAQHLADLTWYRAIVTEAVLNSNVAVRLCDFGHMVCVPIRNLRVLESRFYKIPFMAAKGKLAGILPIHTDWEVEDCVRFQELVKGKLLLAIVTKIEDNTDNPMDVVFHIKLIDTSSDEDEIINEILINENRAVKDTQ